MLTGFGAIRTDTTHLFGDLTWSAFARGQVWRAVTATFIHFSLTHLLLNLIGMVQLGRMMEEWYGSRQFLAVCLVVGGAGNVVGVLMRQGVELGRLWVQAHGLGRILPTFLTEGPPPSAPSAGGSTIILGLIGLGLIVGWRSKTRVGLFLRDQMFGFLVFTAVIGIVGMKVIDNYGHAGGAIVGILVGFLHRQLVRTVPRGFARRAALIGSLALVLFSGGEQWITARHEVSLARSEAKRKATAIQVRLCQIVRDRLIAVGVTFESIAYQRIGQTMASLGDHGISYLDGPPDLSPMATVADLLAGRATPPWPAYGPDRQSLDTFSRSLESLSELKPRLDPRIDGPEFDEIQLVGERLLNGPVSSKDIYLFRLARITLSRRAERVRDALLSESPP